MASFICANMETSVLCSSFVTGFPSCSFRPGSKGGGIVGMGGCKPRKGLIIHSDPDSKHAGRAQQQICQLGSVQVYVCAGVCLCRCVSVQVCVYAVPMQAECANVCACKHVSV